MAQRIRARLSTAEGRRFGVTVGMAFLLLAGLLWWRGFPVGRNVLAGIGGALVLAGLAVPRWLGPVQRGWMGFAHLISKVTTPVVLGLVYFGVMMPIGFGMRLFRRNPIRHVARDDSYWGPRSSARGGMHNQF